MSWKIDPRLQDVIAFAMTSEELMSRVRAMSHGQKLTFVPNQIGDGAPVSESIRSIGDVFTLERISPANVPSAYGLSGDDLIGHGAVLISSVNVPSVVQLGVFDLIGNDG